MILTSTDKNCTLDIMYFDKVCDKIKHAGFVVNADVRDVRDLQTDTDDGNIMVCCMETEFLRSFVRIEKSREDYGSVIIFNIRQLIYIQLSAVKIVKTVIRAMADKDICIKIFFLCDVGHAIKRIIQCAGIPTVGEDSNFLFVCHFITP
ncbi:MAG: hypothetical protein BWY61_01466 [Firmicutes bacterium ADurb.Bin354]|nr:MAG: hypothetical protein BWY61_01466 [Firmicutes bacterium ADurb.Bin354]